MKRVPTKQPAGWTSAAAVVFSVTLLLAPASYAADALVENVCGYSVVLNGDTASARASALGQSLAEAIARAEGTTIWEHIELDDLELVRHMIFREASGYVSSHRVVDEGPDSRGYRVCIDAVVADSPPSEDCSEMVRLWNELKGSPRVMLLGSEADPTFTHALTPVLHSLEARMVAAGYNVVDARIAGEWGAARDRARELDVDYIFSVETASEIVQNGVGGWNIVTASSSALVKVDLVETGDVVFARHLPEEKQGLSSERASVRAALAQLATALEKALVCEFPAATGKPLPVSISICGCAETEVDPIRWQLSRLAGVDDVRFVGYENGAAQYRALTTVSSSALVRHLSHLSDPSFEVENACVGHIELRVRH